MKLRFRVNQAECLKRGIDAPKSIVTIEVNPAELPQPARDALAKCMDGIDICELSKDGEKLYTAITQDELAIGKKQKPCLIEANEPTLKGLLEALMTKDSTLSQLSVLHHVVDFMEKTNQRNN